MGPLRGDDRALRQGPRHRRRLARPLRRDRARGLRPRAAAQPALRVPQHRRAQDVDLARDAAPPPTEIVEVVPAGAAPPALPAAPPEPGDRVRPRRDGRDPAPVRRVRPAGRRRRPAGRSRASCRADAERIFRYALLDPAADVGRRGRRATGPRSRTSPCSPRSPAWTWRPAWPRRRGARSRPRGAPILAERLAAARGWLRVVRARSGRGSSVRRDAPAGGGRGARTGTSGRTSARSPDAAEAAPPASRRRLAGRDLRGRRGGRPARPAAPSARSTSPSWAGRTARGRAGSWPASRPTSSSHGCAAAAGRHDPARVAAADASGGGSA